MNQLSVAITDYLLTFQCVALIAIFVRRGPKDLPVRTSYYFAIFVFASLALATAIGGTLHGFFADVQSDVHQLLWRATLVCVGLTATFLWLLAASLVLSQTWRRRVYVFVALGFVILLYPIFFKYPAFLYAVIRYLIGLVMLIAALTCRYLQTRERGVLLAIVGLLMTLVASGVQVLRLQIDPMILNYNSLYHLLELAALYVLYVGLREVLCKPGAAVDSERNAQEGLPNFTPS